MKAFLYMSYLRYFLQRIGWPPVACAALLLAALLGQIYAVWLPSRELSALRSRLELQARKPLVSAAHAPDKARQLLAFQAGLPASGQALALTASLHSLAQKHRVAISSGAYQLVRNGNADLQKVVIAMPVHADYPALHAWLADALNTQASLALEELHLQRSSSDTGQLEGRVRFALYVRAP
jgi:hypothetical protein